MRVKEEINKYAKEADKPVLLLLFERYHMRSNWLFVASCTFKRYGIPSYAVNRVWEPTEEGRILYKHFKASESLDSATKICPVCLTKNIDRKMFCRECDWKF